MTFRHGFGNHQLLAWLDNTGEALAGMLRPHHRRLADARASALLAWLRCQRVVAHSLSRIVPLPALSTRLYLAAFVLVTACRWLSVTPIPGPTGLPGTSWLRALRTRSFVSQRLPPCARTIDEPTR